MPAAGRLLPNAGLSWDGPGAADDARGSTEPPAATGVPALGAGPGASSRPTSCPPHPPGARSLRTAPAGRSARSCAPPPFPWW